MMTNEQMVEKITQILKDNVLVLTDELDGKAYGHNEIGDIYDGAVYVYNTLTRMCESTVLKWLQGLFKDEPVIVTLCNCSCGENYFEIRSEY